MATTLKRSRSKYGRTRRQRKKQRRIRGGGFLDDIIKQFKPKSNEEKCKEAKEEAENICNRGAEESIEMTEMAPIEPSSYDASIDSISSNNTTTDMFTPSTTPDVYGEKDMGMGTTEVLSQSQPSEISNPMPPSISQLEMEQPPLDKFQPQLESQPPLEPKSQLESQPQPQQFPQSNAILGGAKKSKKTNKKRSQIRRKKLKSRKHKK